MNCRVALPVAIDTDMMGAVGMILEDFLAIRGNDDRASCVDWWPMA